MQRSAWAATWGVFGALLVMGCAERHSQPPLLATASVARSAVSAPPPAVPVPLDLMGVVAVGDFDPSAVESALVERFSDLKNPEQPRVRPSIAVPLAGPARAAIHLDPDLALPEVTVFDRTPPRRLVTREDVRTMFVEHIFAGILQERLGEVAETGPVLVRSSVGRRQLARDAGAFVYSATARPGKLENALYILLTELERIGRFGVLPDEFERACDELRAQKEISSEEAERQPLFNKAAELVRHLFENEEVAGPAGELAQLNPAQRSSACCCIASRTG
jgi:zinc protease